METPQLSKHTMKCISPNLIWDLQLIFRSVTNILLGLKHHCESYSELPSKRNTYIQIDRCKKEETSLDSEYLEAGMSQTYVDSYINLLGGFVPHFVEIKMCGTI